MKTIIQKTVLVSLLFTASIKGWAQQYNNNDSLSQQYNDPSQQNNNPPQQNNNPPVQTGDPSMENTSISTGNLDPSLPGNDATLLDMVARDDQAAIDAIAMYPQDVRANIFVAAKYPEVAGRLSNMQKTTNASFTALLAPYPKDEQEKIYNLTRYPDLISQLVSDHRRSDDEIRNILIGYPDEIHETAIHEMRDNYDLLVQIAQNTRQYDRQFDDLMSHYPYEAAVAYKNLVKTPEVLSTLTNNMQLTVVVGDVYKRNPDLVKEKTDSINYVVTQKNAQDAAEWQQSLQNNPQAQQEYQQAAQQYAQENGYQQDEYNTPMSSDVENYTSYPYNWWLGYPFWQPYAYWNPYPYWYDCGFYYGSGHAMVYTGMPSSYFMNWYFNNPQHHVLYPELSNHYYNYYQGHRGGVGYNPISRSVDNWHTRNADVFGNGFDRNPAGRPQMFREYGQMEVDRHTYNRQNPGHPVNRQEFLQNHQNNYSNIRSLSSDAARNRGYSRPEQQQQGFANRPHAPISKSYNYMQDPAKSGNQNQNGQNANNHSQQNGRNYWQNGGNQQQQNNANNHPQQNGGNQSQQNNGDNRGQQNAGNQSAQNNANNHPQQNGGNQSQQNAGNQPAKNNDTYRPQQNAGNQSQQNNDTYRPQQNAGNQSQQNNGDNRGQQNAGNQSQQNNAYNRPQQNGGNQSQQNNTYNRQQQTSAQSQQSNYRQLNTAVDNHQSSWQQMQQPRQASYQAPVRQSAPSGGGGGGGFHGGGGGGGGFHGGGGGRR